MTNPEKPTRPLEEIFEVGKKLIDDVEQYAPVKPEMSLRECKDEVAKKHGYKNFEAFDDKLTFGQDDEISNALKFMDEVAELYASQKQAGGWISVEDRLPDKSFKNKDGEIYVIGILEGVCDWLYFNEEDKTFWIPFIEQEYPSHWLDFKLPESPPHTTLPTPPKQ